MADVQRTRAAILALMADNVTGQISPQDFRDFIVTVMEAEFANPGDFWKQPEAGNMITNNSIKGWIQYSQIIVSACSFGKVLYNSPTGWKCAGASATADHAGVLGVAGGNYAAAESQAQILRRGMVMCASHSIALSARIGNYVYLANGQSGGISYAAAASTVVVGVVELSAVGDAGLTSYKWRFEPTWGVTTV